MVRELSLIILDQQEDNLEVRIHSEDSSSEEELGDNRGSDRVEEEDK